MVTTRDRAGRGDTARGDDRFLRIALRTDGYLTFPADSRVESGESLCIGDTGDAVRSDRSILYGVLECP